MSNHLNLKMLTEEVCQLAKTIAGYLKYEVGYLKREAIEVKGQHDFVTYIDKTAEEQIMARLAHLLPEAGFIAEETENLKKVNVSTG